MVWLPLEEERALGLAREPAEEALVWPPVAEAMVWPLV